MGEVGHEGKEVRQRFHVRESPSLSLIPQESSGVYATPQILLELQTREVGFILPHSSVIIYGTFSQGVHKLLSISGSPPVWSEWFQLPEDSLLWRAGTSTMKPEGCMETVKGIQGNTVTVCYRYYEDSSHTCIGVSVFWYRFTRSCGQSLDSRLQKSCLCYSSTADSWHAGDSSLNFQNPMMLKRSTQGIFFIEWKLELIRYRKNDPKPSCKLCGIFSIWSRFGTQDSTNISEMKG